MNTEDFRHGVHQIDGGTTFLGWWRVCLETNGAKLFLGLFQTEDAARAASEKRVNV